MTTPSTTATSPNLCLLPYEIRLKILADLLTAPWPVTFDGSFKAAHNQDVREVHRILDIIDILPSGSRLFYARNTFHVSCHLISSFLSHQISPSRTQSFPSDTVIQGDPTMSKEHVTHLSAFIDPMLHDTRETAGLLRCLLSCPRLKQVDIEIGSFFEALSEFDATFYRIREVCWQLGEKLGGGDLNLNVKLHWLYGKARWRMRDFEGGKPPQ
ncbi:MAG: hypothetical protein Q9193_006322 [Seirophora villosa]